MADAINKAADRAEAQISAQARKDKAASKQRLQQQEAAKAEQQQQQKVKSLCACHSDLMMLPEKERRDCKQAAAAAAAIGSSQGWARERRRRLHHYNSKCQPMSLVTSSAQISGQQHPLQMGMSDGLPVQDMVILWPISAEDFPCMMMT